MSESSIPIQAIGNPQPTSPAATALFSSWTRLTPFVPAPAATPVNTPSGPISSSSGNPSPAGYPQEHTVVPPKSPKKSLIEFIWKIAIREELAALSQETLSL